MWLRDTTLTGDVPKGNKLPNAPEYILNALEAIRPTGDRSTAAFRIHSTVSKHVLYQSLADAIAKFNAAIQSMKIDGPVGQFLRDASTTGADPRALFDPEIKKYLDDNPKLWAALRVGLK